MKSTQSNTSIRLIGPTSTMTNKRTAAIAFASLMAESVAFSSRSAFTASPPESYLHPQRTSLSVSQSTSTADLTSSSSEDNPWWKEFQLNDSALPTSVLLDFPILTSTSFNSDGQLTTNDDDDVSKRLIYLDSAATSQKPTAVTAALDDYYLKYNSYHPSPS